MRLIDADALAHDLEYDVDLCAKALDDMNLVGKERKDMQFQKDCKQNCIWYISEQPTVEPTLYGYKIETLALIARVMQKDGVTPEKAVQIFKDVQTIALKVIDEINRAVEQAFEQVTEKGGRDDKID